ncbi:TetR/AcrR family transcriptional regulator [Mycolicibacterium komossense]|uniref:TetR/AcrR family transcriptional regulator n=1 Tax=Mycolicibacterium komossense TaxID=1779 RepID=A0ABT3CGC8_9MYCO|nr:TetR/AcrR family transcriptional regulator [Mycolicibacterium komossense]
MLDAAATLFADRGISVPLEEVARQAGVGVATLYRRFPARADLAAAIFERNISRYTDAVDRAVADPQAGNGFGELVIELCRLQAADAGLRELLTTAFPASSVIERTVAESAEKLRELIARGQREGSLRPDLAVADVGVMLLANAGVVGATAGSAPEAWRRFAALIVDACSTAPSSGPLPPAPPEDRLRRSIANLPA